MNIHEVRRQNLYRLIQEQFDGKQRRLADAIDRQPDYISRILKGTKNVGETFARHVERSVGISEGSLDKRIENPTMGSGGFLKRSTEYLEEEDFKLEPPRVMETGHLQYHPIQSGRAPSEEAKSRAVRDMFDDELEFVGHMDAWDSDTPLDEDEVELPLFREVELAAGAGQTQVVENHGAKLRFAKSTLSRARVEQANAACAFVRGNSMDPVMPDGTCVGVNTGDTTIRDGEIYAIDHDGMLRVKYLHRRPGGGIKIVSQNASEHATEEYSAQAVIDNNIRVIGRVFWWSVLR